MLNIIFALILIATFATAAKRFYFPTEMAEHPELYPVSPDKKITKKDLTTILTHLLRWKEEGKITREECDHLTDICLSEMKQIEGKIS